MKEELTAKGKEFESMKKVIEELKLANNEKDRQFIELKEEITGMKKMIEELKVKKDEEENQLENLAENVKIPIILLKLINFY